MEMQAAAQSSQTVISNLLLYLGRYNVHA